MSDEKQIKKGQLSGTAHPVENYKEKLATTTIKGAVILTPELAERILSLFNELPRRFSPLVDPIQKEFLSSAMGDVTLHEQKVTVKNQN